MTDPIQPPARTAFVARVAELAIDGAALAGAGLIVAGVAQIFVPAGEIVGGGFLLAAAWRAARRGAAG